MGHFNVAFQEVLAGDVLGATEVVAFLPYKEFAQVDLDLRPGPEEVPTVPEVETMRELLPMLLLREGSGDDIVDLCAVLDDTIVQRGVTGFAVCLIGCWRESCFLRGILDNLVDILVFYQVLIPVLKFGLCQGLHHIVRRRDASDLEDGWHIVI